MFVLQAERLHRLGRVRNRRSRKNEHAIQSLKFPSSTIRVVLELTSSPCAAELGFTRDASPYLLCLHSCFLSTLLKNIHSVQIASLYILPLLFLACRISSLQHVPRFP